MRLAISPASIYSTLKSWAARWEPLFASVVLTLFFFYMATVMLLDPDKDTLHMPGAAFAVSLGLASVTFAYGRAMNEGERLRDEVVFCGECFLVSSYLSAIASIFKYGSIDIPKHIVKLSGKDLATDADAAGDYVLGQGAFNLFAILFLFFALLEFQRGLVHLSIIVYYRSRHRRMQPDSFFDSRAFARSLEEEDRSQTERHPEVPS